VKFEDKQQVEQMLMLELRRNKVQVGETSSKQGTKDLPSRGSK
jgi:hypothetical protein